MYGEWVYVFRFFIAWLIMSLCVLPLCMVLFKSFPDRGYIFSKPIGVILSGGLLWWLSSLKLYTFDIINQFVCIIFVFLISSVIYIIDNKSIKTISDITAENLFCGLNLKTLVKKWIIIEMAFLIILTYYCYLRGSYPDITSDTEKMMNYAILEGLHRADYMPPVDVWYSGKPINYYYLGHFFTVFIAGIVDLTPEYSYNIMCGSIFALGILQSFFIVYYLLMEKSAGKRAISFFGGLVSSLAVMIAGNFHYVLYGLLKIVRKTDGSDYWFGDSIRFIGYDPENMDKTIHEIPSYSLLVGDLHAHVINIVFVLTVTGVLLSWMMKRRDRLEAEEPSSAIFLEMIKNAFNLEVIIASIIVGAFAGINFWDFPVYFTVAGAVILFSNIMMYRDTKSVIISTAFQGISFFVMAWVVSLPFRSNLKTVYSVVKLTDRHSAFIQLMILWGLPVFTSILFYLSLRGKRLEAPDLFVLTITLCAIGLVIIPELIYVKDIYDAEYQRANTMFKLVYRAWMLFGLGMGYIFAVSLFLEKKKAMRTAGIMLFVPFVLTLGYFHNGAETLFGGLLGSGYSTLDGTYFMDCSDQGDGAATMADDKAAIDYINENIDDERAVILEADGDSYSFYGRISTFTGHPTVLQWRAHEWLWREDDAENYSMPADEAQRIADIRTIYTSHDNDLADALIAHYNIQYIVTGYCEYAKEEEWGEPVALDRMMENYELIFYSDDNEKYPVYVFSVHKG